MVNGLTQNYIEALGKQVFAKDYILNGLFVCGSDIIKMIQLGKKEWKFNDKFEYRMLLASTRSGGGINSQTFDKDFNLQRPGQLQYGMFEASYGTISDGFRVDMVKQLETKEKRAAFNTDYSLGMHSLRINVSSIYKANVIHGREVPIHRVTPPIKVRDSEPCRYVLDYMVDREVGWKKAKLKKLGTDGFTIGADTGENDGKPIGTDSFVSPGSYWALEGLKRGSHIRMPIPRNVFASGFKTGSLFHRASVERSSTTSNTPQYTTPNEGRFAPWGRSYIFDAWVVYDLQARMLDLVYVGPNVDGVYPLYIGDFFYMFGSRKAKKQTWDKYHLTRESAGGNSYPGFFTGMDEYVSPDGISGGISEVELYAWKKDGETSNTKIAYNLTNGALSSTSVYDGADIFTENTGTMEGLADMFPWHTKLSNDGMSDGFSDFLGLNRFYRGHKDRLQFTAEQAGMRVYQNSDMTIMDSVYEGVELSASAVGSYDDMCIWINPTTLAAIGMYEQMAGGNGGGLQVYKNAEIPSKLIYQRGISAINYRIGEKIFPNVIKDYNLPTDVIIIGPLNDLEYNCWDNAAFELDEYIQKTYDKKNPPKIKDIHVPLEMSSKLDLSKRIIVGNPTSADLTLQTLGGGYNGFVHPSNSIPIAYQEMGALFTENPYAYCVVKLRNQIIRPSDTLIDNWMNCGR